VPLSRRQILRRRRITVFGGLGLVLATAFYLPFTLLAPLHASAASLDPYIAPTTSAPTLTFPGYGATAVGAVDFPGILAKSGTDAPLPLASITKIVTALVVLEAKPLGVQEPGADIAFTQADVAIYNDYLARFGSVKPVKAGLVLSYRQVLELTVVASANNYAQSLVNWAFGSEAAFVPVANAWLADHGLSSMVLTDATGMNPENVGTASDLVELGRLALADPLVSVLVSTKAVSIPSVGEIKNTNKLLGDAGVRGIKTGTLDEANLLFAADQKVGDETVTVIGVMLGAKDHKVLDADVVTLLKSVKPGFQEVVLASAGQEYGSYSTLWGDTADAVAAEDAVVVVWADTAISLLVKARPVTLGTKGEDIGMLTFTVGASTIEVPIELDATIDDPGPGWRLSHPTELF